MPLLAPLPDWSPGNVNRSVVKDPARAQDSELHGVLKAQTMPVPCWDANVGAPSVAPRPYAREPVRPAAPDKVLPFIPASAPPLSWHNNVGQFDLPQRYSRASEYVAPVRVLPFIPASAPPLSWHNNVGQPAFTAHSKAAEYVAPDKVLPFVPPPPPPPPPPPTPLPPSQGVRNTGMQLLIDNGNGEVDYTQYVLEGTLQIQDSINIPTLLNFSLANVDDAFIVPVRSAYVRLWSNKFDRNIITGFVTSTPTIAYLGSSQRVPSFGFQHMTYQVQVTSDEWLLNVTSVPFIPAYVNQTQGAILAALANTLVSGFFDTSQVQAGNPVPYYKYDPSQKWSDIAKSFGDASRFRYKVVGKQIVFAPFGDTPLGVSYDEELGSQRSFDPRALDTTILTVPPVNDALVVGDTEPQSLHDDYFIGDGFTSNFPLRHTIFSGSTNLLLEDDWTSGSLNSQNWTVADPLGQFILAGALNAVGSPLNPAVLGQDYILANNGLELGGHLVIQHGDFTFVDVNLGIVGGVYSVATSLSSSGCLAGFNVFTASGDLVSPSPSGATNVAIQPILLGVAAGPIVKTKINHQYILLTYINARRYTRYNQIYQTLAGTVFGDQNLPALADISFVVQDIDQTFPWQTPVQTQYNVTGVNLPTFGTYAILNSQYMNLNLNNTLISRPPQALLTVAGLSGASGGQLPLRDPGSPVPLPLGFGQTSQVATIKSSSGSTQGGTPVTTGDSDELVFYAGLIGANGGLLANTIPAPGARIRVQSWESGRSLAHVQDPLLVAQEAKVFGDTGVRSAVFTNLNPLPRSSEECEQAALAQIADRSDTQYQGSYTIFDYFWDGFSADYPCTGRYLYVNAPLRNIYKQDLLISQVTTTVIEMHDEILQFQISFGQDLFLEKLLARFIATPTDILEPNDAAKEPTLQFVNQVGTLFLDDLNNAQLTQITGTNVTVDLGVLPVTGCEVRRADYGWGTTDQNLIGVFTTQTFSLPRTTYEQIWYMRLVNGPLSSRFTRVMRVAQPIVPLAPVGTVNGSNPLKVTLNLQFTGDIRNIAGVEVRAADNATVLYQKIVLSQGDLNIDVTLQQNVSLVYYCYFFNYRWEYSPAVIPTLLNFRSGHVSYRPTTNPLTAIDAGGTATTDVTAFVMRSGLTDVNVASGAITNLAYDTTYFVYYDDPEFVGGAVVYHATTTREVALNSEVRFFVGSIRTPKSGGSVVTGNNDGGGGAQYSKTFRILPANTVLTGSWTDPENAIDDDTSTYAVANSSGSNIVLVANQFLPFAGQFSAKILQVINQVVAVSGGTVLVEYSQDGGTSWTTLRNVGSTDSAPVISQVALPLSLLTSLVQVRITLPGGVVNASNVLYAGSGADDASTGTLAWTNPSNAVGNQTAVFSNVNLVGGGATTTHYLQLTNFGFGGVIPAGSTPTGIAAAVTLQGSYSGYDLAGNAIFVNDNSIRLYRAGVLDPGGTDMAGTNNWPTSIGTELFGGSSSLWGSSWSLADVSDPGFGIGISAYMEVDGVPLTATAQVYNVAITIYYTTTAGGAASTTRIYDIAQVVTW